MPLESIVVRTAPFVQGVQAGLAATYSGSWAFWTHQMSVLAVNVDSGAWQHPTGITKLPSPPFYSPAGGLLRTGDFWQTVIGIAASKDVPKWLVCTGSPNAQADPDTWGLQVFRFEGGVWRPKGVIDARIERTRTPVIVGDMAWAQGLGSINPPWFSFDLVTMTIASTNAGPPPGQERQPDIGGFMYDLQPDLSAPTQRPAMLRASHPFLPEQTAPTVFNVTRIGGPVLPTFCPNDKIDRKQVAAIVYNAMKWIAANPGVFPPPVPDDQQFSDVAMDNPFRPAIDALKAAGIIAGKSPCGQ